MADKLYNAFNGRFFREEGPPEFDGSDGEAMHTVFLSEPTFFPDVSDDGAEFEELELLSKFSVQHGNVNFDRLPTCPLCLEKLDATVTGMH